MGFVEGVKGVMVGLFEKVLVGYTVGSVLGESKGNIVVGDKEGEFEGWIEG